MCIDANLAREAKEPGTRILATYRPVLDDDGRKIGVTVLFRDDTPQTLLVGDTYTIHYEVVNESDGVDVMKTEGPLVDG